jgi:hypothetical protein
MLQDLNAIRRFAFLKMLSYLFDLRTMESEGYPFVTTHGANTIRFLFCKIIH